MQFFCDQVGISFNNEMLDKTKALCLKNKTSTVSCQIYQRQFDSNLEKSGTLHLVDDSSNADINTEWYVDNLPSSPWENYQLLLIIKTHKNSTTSQFTNTIRTSLQDKTSINGFFYLTVDILAACQP